MTGPTGFQGDTGPTGPTGPTGQFAPHSNLLMVDQVYGNDTSAAITPATTSFQTINAATNYLTTNSLTGYTVFVYPGTYYEAVTVPASHSLRGSSNNTTTITLTGPTGTTTLLTMGNQTRVEDFTLTLLASTGAGPYTGVLFPNGTTTAAKIRNCVINANYLGTDTAPPLYGILANDTTTSRAFNPADALRGSTVNVSSTTTGPNGPYGLYNVGTSYFGVRDSNINATGPVPNPTGTIGPIGVTTSNTGCLVSLKGSNVAGALYDILQAAPLRTGTTGSIGSIILNATDLINANAGTNSFIVNSGGPTISYIVTQPLTFNLFSPFAATGSAPIQGSSTYFLLPGCNMSSALFRYLDFNTQNVGITFPEKTIVYQAVIHGIGVNVTSNVTVTLLKAPNFANGNGVAFATGIISVANPGPIILRGSTSFRPFLDFLQVRVVVASTLNVSTVAFCVTVSTY